MNNLYTYNFTNIIYVCKFYFVSGYFPSYMGGNLDYQWMTNIELIYAYVYLPVCVCVYVCVYVL
jgi:hypothetical protein